MDDWFQELLSHHLLPKLDTLPFTTSVPAATDLSPFVDDRQGPKERIRDHPGGAFLRPVEKTVSGAGGRAPTR